MSHVVTENCTDCRFTDCVTVCPVACFHSNGARVYIDPKVCIDCGSCVPVCPVQAIVEDFDLSPGQADWVDINATVAPTLPVIRGKQPPLPTAEAQRRTLGY